MFCLATSFKKPDYFNRISKTKSWKAAESFLRVSFKLQELHYWASAVNICLVGVYLCVCLLSINILISCERHSFVFKKYLLKLMVTSKVGTVGDMY